MDTHLGARHRQRTPTIHEDHSAGSELRAHKPEAQAKVIRKYISFNALRLRFRLVASDFPGIVCILEGD
jgi:hypothetical protein